MSEKIKTAVMEVIKAHMVGEDKNTKAVLSDVMESVNELETFEQEPCEEAISREAVLSKIKEVCFSEEWTQFRLNNGSNGQRDFIIDYIEQLPPVMQKYGKWIHFAQSDDCSLCGYSTGKYGSPSKYCPDCGAKMVELQESGDKE